ncbi:hypothetical protein ERO13_D02G226600v2 [Gossypium hirsutum]|uniref:Uncharacterized protein LOC107908649 n=1 Tax=Gossypium hirsutum TaxID=3635 RepID=A0A1U8JSX2_GOSHI|nr:uncharacterized protein LOC107908649 [Gossypium hirsutum]XP_016691375.1 uncharacterized protein LOC107908649 [Gossypium hirsutum]XP_040945206.1 uncharacterized protein LOC107908649 [Gossypium hirsutum]KAG4160271.1 hypothetical protein ERO13_D02G226600v2 [Gossypium hirsutum]KAG4160272.1 hypothetical protein ERO13_D02G226600v2 [Gossypium hirsutum]
MDGNGRVHPDCPNAANPYHECGGLCLEKIAEGKGPKAKETKKSLSSKFLDASRSFGRRKKGSDSLLRSPKALETTPAIGAVYPGGPRSPRSHFSRKKMEAENGESYSSSEQHSGEIYSQDQSFEKAPIEYSQPLHMSGKITPPADTPTKFTQTEKVKDSPKINSDANMNDEKVNAISSAFSFLIGQDHEESDDEADEVESVISDSCVSVGKYHVKASISTILQSIFEKYGDIAANCQLESASMRAYYLECLCAVIQELHSIPFKQLTKAKIKEMFAVLKDVESAHIDVDWLRALLNEISEALELVNQRQTFEAKKTKYNQSLESVRKELESKMDELAQKEKEAADAREQVAETKARLDEIEHQCSELDKTISTIASITDKFQGKSLADEIL